MGLLQDFLELYANNSWEYTKAGGGGMAYNVHRVYCLME